MEDQEEIFWWKLLFPRHPIFQRQDMPYFFYCAHFLFAQAALGGDVRIKTVDGDVIYTGKTGNKNRYKSTSSPEKEFPPSAIPRYEATIM